MPTLLGKFLKQQKVCESYWNYKRCLVYPILTHPVLRLLVRVKLFYQFPLKSGQLQQARLLKVNWTCHCLNISTVVGLQRWLCICSNIYRRMLKCLWTLKGQHFIDQNILVRTYFPCLPARNIMITSIS